MILLDTHAWLWWIQGAAELPDKMRAAIQNSIEPVALASVSCLEVAWLVKKGRITISRPLDEWFELAIDKAGLILLDLTPQIAARSAFLPDIHRDPVDRVIVATAIEYSAQLFSKDERISEYRDAKVFWG